MNLAVNNKVIKSANDWVQLFNGASSPSASKLYGLVSYFYRGVELRAMAVQQMPFDIVRVGGDVVTDEELDNLPKDLAFLSGLKSLLYMTEASACLYGAAYWENQKGATTRRPLNLQYLKPYTIDPEFHTRTGELLRFYREMDAGRRIPLEVEDIVYFWSLDPDVESGPAVNYPARAALGGAAVLFHMEEFLSSFFERGMIKATVLQIGEDSRGLTQDEADHIKGWWNIMVSGIKNAWNTLILRGDINPIVIGEGIESLENATLTQSERENISTALGVPQSKLLSNAANFCYENR